MGITIDGILNKRVNGTWIGDDISMLLELINGMNASLEIVNISEAKIYSALTHTKYHQNVDFYFFRTFATYELLEKVYLINPKRKDSLLGVVPQSTLIPPYMYFFMIYDYSSLLILGVLIIIVAFIVKLGREFTMCNAVFTVLRCLFQGSVCCFIKKPPSTKIVLLSFILFSVLNSVFFCTCLTSMLFTKKYYPDIDTIPGLDNSNLKIHIRRLHYRLLPDILKGKVTITSKKGIFEKLHSENKNAFIIPETYILTHIQSGKCSECMANFHEYFHIMRQSIVPGFTTYVFPRSCPYAVQIAKFLKKYDSVDNRHYLQYWKRKYLSVNDDKENDKLTFLQWTSIFSILIIGHFLAVLVLILELIVHKYY